MNWISIFSALIGALGGVGGIALAIRAKSQNRLDQARAGREVAETESLEVRVAREMIAEIRVEMDRKVQGLERELGRLAGKLEASNEERDSLRKAERRLLEENRKLRTRVEQLEREVVTLREQQGE